MADAGEIGSAENVQSQAALVDVTDFTTYLRRVIPPILDDQSDTLSNALKEKTTLECLKKFIGDPQVPTLMVQRLALKG